METLPLERTRICIEVSNVEITGLFGNAKKERKKQLVALPTGAIFETHKNFQTYF